jgi:hypothetical protein
MGNRDVVHRVVHGTIHSLSTTPKATILQLITVNYMHHPIAIKFFFGQKKGPQAKLAGLLISSVSAINLHAGDADVTEDTGAMVKGWLDSHIPAFDMPYADALNG